MGGKRAFQGSSFFVECPGPNLEKELFLCCRGEPFKRRDGDGSAAIEDEGESVGNWSLLEDDKDAGCSLLLEERGASAGCSIEGCDPDFLGTLTPPDAREAQEKPLVKKIQKMLIQ